MDFFSCIQAIGKSIWGLLNANIVSEALGAFLFASILHRYLSRSENKEIVNKLKEILEEQNERNLDVCTKLLTDVNAVTIFSTPFHLSAVQLCLQDRFIKVLPSHISVSILQCCESLMHANELHRNLRELTTSGYANTAAGFADEQILFNTWSDFLPKLKTDLERLSSDLKLYNKKAPSFG